MISHFNGFESDSAMGRVAQSILRVCLNKVLLLIGAGVLGLVLLRAIADNPQDLRNTQVVAKLLAREQANAWSAEELRLQAVIADTKQRHTQFRRDQPNYNQTIVDDTRAQMVRHISQGVAPSKALAMAVQEAERGGQLQRVISE